MSDPTSIQLSTWARNVSPSPTLAVDSKAKAMTAAGEDVCGFGAGEPDFDTPEFIKEACAKALQDGMTKYSPAPGLPALRSALAEKYVNENGIDGLDAANIVVSPGGKYSCMLAIMATCSPGDEVIIPAPFWVSYPEMAKLAGASPVIIPSDDSTGFKVTPAQIEAAITPKTKLLIINSPSNPTGAVYTRSELEAITEVVVRRGITMMSDEIYEYLLYDDAEHVSPASFSKEAAAHVITVSGFSKTFSMTGWRLGTLVAPAHVAKSIGSIQSQTTSNPTTFAQYGALAAMQEPDKARAAVAEMLRAFDRRRHILHKGLNAISGISCLLAQGAFYLFPNLKETGLDADTFAERILEEQKVAVVSGVGFGAPGFMRLSYATSDSVIERGLERMAAFCAAL